MNYSTLIPEVKTLLESITKVKAVYSYPATKYSKYPAVLFYPSFLENAFETTTENRKGYNFKIFVIIGLRQLSPSSAFEDVLPGVVDDVISKFDESWNGGVTANGQRITYQIDSGEWGLDETQDGLVSYAEMNLIIKTNTTN